MRPARARRVIALAAVVALGAMALGPVGSAVASAPSKNRCATAWYEWQYSSIAPGFPVTLSVKERNRLVKDCKRRGLLPEWDAQVRLTQKAFNVTAQILEREIHRVATETGRPPCEALIDVLKPVGAKGAPLKPGDDVEGYGPDSFLPITRYNWYGGPFRLKFGVGCMESPWANLWLFADPYPPAGDHPERYPTDADVKKDPWPRKPVEGPMSTCITWGPGLKNDGVDGRGFIFAFDWSRENLPLDVRSCYPKALGLDGLGKYPFKVVPNLPL